MIVIHPSCTADADLLSPFLRLADIAEVRASSGLSPKDALLHGMAYSDPCYTGFVDDAPIMIFGVCPEDNPMIGRVWLLGSDGIVAHKYDFLRKSKWWLEHFHKQFPVLYNYIDARNTYHIKWLQWLGFSFIREYPDYGVEKRLFYQFVRINSNV